MLPTYAGERGIATMPRRQVLIGIDVGGTAVKVGAFDAQGHLLGLRQAPIAVHSPQPGWAEITPDDWLAAINSGMRAILKQGDVQPAEIVAIGLSNMIGTVVPLDAAGRPLRPAIAYFDTRSAAEAAEMLARAPSLPQVTANRVTSGNTSLASVLWLQKHEPRVYAKADLFAQTGTLLFYWLTGERRVDWTNASFAGIFDYRQRDWSAPLASALGIERDRLAPIAAPHSSAPLRPEVAAELGIPTGMPVALGGIDGAMASLGVGAIHPGDAYDVSGTSEMIAVCLPQPVAAPELLARWHVVPGVWVLIGAISTPGAAWQWFAEQLMPEEAEDVSALYARMTAEAAATPIGANGIVFLPHMMGERAPIWDPHARGVFYGLSLSTTRGDMIRAIMEGAAYAMRHLLELIAASSGQAVQRVVTVGGASRNALWRQIKADVWHVALATTPVCEATSLGAAMTAGVAAGIYADYEEAVRRAVPPTAEVTLPDAARHAAYEHSYRVYRRLYPALADTMHFAATGRE